MTARRPPFVPRRLTNYIELARSFSDSQAMAAADFHQFEQVVAAVKHHLGLPLHDARILEIGCGQRCGVTLLLGASGARAVGIDTAFVGPLFSVLSAAVWRHGTERTIKTAARRALFDRSYYRHLAALSGGRLDFSRVEIRLMNACQMDFADESFDFIYSCAAFEHITDVPAATDEVWRVLKRGGLGYFSIHLYPSISGGHSLEWRDPENYRPRYVPPWDHLRGNRFPSGAGLNQFRESDYVNIFGARFTIVEARAKYEGLEYLTPEIESECTTYSRDELLKANVGFILRKGS